MSNQSVIGKIYSVACKDFVTYNEVKFYADEHLNIIIGPNGTGKSTLIAAIILGMGGSAKLLSRSNRIEDYIKNGKQEAGIIIEIYRNLKREKINFERTINMDGKSTWKVDGIKYTAQDYLLVVHKYNIHINNLCQFLPQDRVQDFAKMNPQEILSCTISSVCSPEFLKQYESLKEMRHNQLNLKNILQNNLDKLKEYEERNAQLKIQIDRINIRKTLENDIHICEIKQTWLRYLQEKEKFDKITLELQQVKSIVKKHQKQFENIKKESLSVIKCTEDYQKIIHNEEQKSRLYTNEMESLKEKCEELESSIRSAEANLQREKNEQEEKATELENEKKLLEAHLQDLKNAIADLSTEDEQKVQSLNKKLDDRKNQIKLLNDKHRELNHKIDYQTPQTQLYQRKITNLQNLGERKLNMLRERFNNVYQGVVWLRNNQHLFEGKIYEPMILEINVLDLSYAKYIENSVSMRDLLAFTCENKSDMATLISHLVNERGLRINAIHSDPSSQCQYFPKENIDKYKKLGFFSYLINMIDGPAPILNFLCQVYNLHVILAGTEEVTNNLEQIPQHIRKYYAGNYCYSISISKYSGESSSMRTDISDKNLLSIGINTNELHNLQKKVSECLAISDRLKNERNNIETQLSNMEKERNGFLDEKKLFERKKSIIQQKKDRIVVQKQKIERLEKYEINIEEEEKKIKKFSKDIVPQHFQLQMKKIICFEKNQQAIALYEFTRSKLNITKRENAELEEKFRTAKEAVTNAEKLMDSISNTYSKAHSKIQNYLIEIKNKSEGTKPDQPNFIYKRDFAKIPNDLNELTDMLYEKQSQVNCMVNENQSIFEEYEKQCQSIENLKESIQQITESDKKKINEITVVHNICYPEIMRIIDIINTNFGKFMSSMEYVGEVQLGRKEEHDYDSYGIQIFVQYRNNTKLQALDRFVQSGGERAVAIAIYTLSMQHITNVPFRCVDEINQGMDPRNERKIFEMLVEETAKPDQSQYFFVTPKLLPDLPYNDYMTIHIVHNGSFIENSHVFDIARQK